jgi:hypothetical protein
MFYQRVEDNAFHLDLPTRYGERVLPCYSTLVAGAPSAVRLATTDHFSLITDHSGGRVRAWGAASGVPLVSEQALAWD